MRKKLRQLARLSCCEWIVFSQLLFFALIIAIGLQRLAILPLMSRINWCAESRPLKYLPFLSRRYERERLLNLVRLAARVVGGTGSCLLRSLLVFWLLKSRREPVKLLLGVRRKDAGFQAHAWVEAQGVVINENPEHVCHFAPLLHV